MTDWAVSTASPPSRDLRITPEEWQAFMDDLQQTFDKFGVPQPEQQELIAIVESTRGDIVVT